ncbi:VOC family protein [Phyllobacterium bourgognense]|uniref:Glyoxalase-like protein n=1 Tax=Phyllobacterium bourgognense TaxID=314236 RepID=A0A368Z281_9HYPH|nr:VOC family protein [Phyllobacterium bourgognense]RCW85566.1 glyoxalase-like protein [Phyllobacterium bourgognense]
MLQFDHMTVIAPTLEEGIEYVSNCLEIDLINGTTHTDMCTHNRRVKLGESCYLEVIAINPDAPSPSCPRWFGLDEIEAVRTEWSKGARLRGWVARTNEIDKVLRLHGHLLGSTKWLDDHFNFSVPAGGELPMGGILPSVIDVGDNPPTATSLVDQGVRLREFVLEHPTPSKIIALYNEMGIVEPPKVREGARPCFSALLDTPSGLTVLK